MKLNDLFREAFSPHSRLTNPEIGKMNPYFDRLRQKANKYFDLDMKLGHQAAIAQSKGDKEAFRKLRQQAEEARQKWLEIRKKTGEYSQAKNDKFNRGGGTHWSKEKPMSY